MRRVSEEWHGEEKEVVPMGNSGTKGAHMVGKIGWDVE